jgi:hypothetical protein
MTIHAHSTWNFGDSITEELIDEIVRVVKENGRVLTFAILSQADNFAYFIMEKGNIESIISNSPEELHTQIREIWTRVQAKL